MTKKKPAAKAAAKRATAKKAAKPKSPAKPKPAAEAARPGKVPTEDAIERAVDSIMNPDVVTGDNVDLVNGFKCTTRNQLKTLAKGYDSLKSDSKSTSQAIGDMLTKAVENKHLDKQAFQLALRCRKLKPRTLTVFMKYLDDLGVFEEAAAQLEMFKEDDVSPDDDEVDRSGERQGMMPLADAMHDAVQAAQGLSPSRRPAFRVVDKPPGEEGSGGAAA